MFEQQIERTINLITEKTIAGNDSIKIREVLSSDIGEPVKTFFSADVDEWITEELNRLHAAPHFDYSEELLHSLLVEVNQKSKEHAVYKRDEFFHSLEKGVKLLFNYTCRPQWTMAKFLFGETGKKAVVDILHELRFFYDYKYYRIILEKYFSTRNFIDFPINKFEELVGLIDHEMVKNFNSYQMAEIASPIFTLFNMDIPIESASVPLEALSIFYDDKGNTAIVERLEKERETKGNVSISLHDLKLLINEVEFSVTLEISDLVSEHVIGEPKEKRATLITPVESASMFETTHGIFEEERSTIFPRATEEIPSVETPAVSAQTSDEGLTHTFDVPDFGDLETQEKSSGSEAVQESFASFPATEKSTLTATGVNESYEMKKEPAVSEGDLFTTSEKSSEAVPEISFEFDKAFEDQTEKKFDAEFETLIEEDKTKFDGSIPEFSFSHADVEQATEPAAKEESIEEAPLAKVTEPTAASDPITKFGDLRTLISAGDRKKYIKKIFQRNEERYASAIDILNSKSTWKEASEYIDEIFLTNDVDMYSRVAVNFTDEIYKRYLPKK